MKKMILLLTISLSLLTIQSCNNDKKATDDKVKTTTEVPAAVKSAFSAKYSSATDIKWEDAHEDKKQTYKAKFTVDGKKMKAEFDANGGFVKESDDN